MRTRQASYFFNDRNRLRLQVLVGCAAGRPEGKATVPVARGRSVRIVNARVQCEKARTLNAGTATYGEDLPAQLIERPF